MFLLARMLRRFAVVMLSEFDVMFDDIRLVLCPDFMLMLFSVDILDFDCVTSWVCSVFLSSFLLFACTLATDVVLKLPPVLMLISPVLLISLPMIVLELLEESVRLPLDVIDDAWLIVSRNVELCLSEVWLDWNVVLLD